jgi:hypothetical protein
LDWNSPEVFGVGVTVGVGVGVGVGIGVGVGRGVGVEIVMVVGGGVGVGPGVPPVTEPGVWAGVVVPLPPQPKAKTHRIVSTDKVKTLEK